MAQPFSRSVDLPPVGELDTAHGQFWVGNAWDIVSQGHNLSGFERNRTFINLGDGQFADVSYLTGTDSDGDGRAVIPIDLNRDGMQDLVVRQSGGGALKVFLNRFPNKHYLRVSLRGSQSNSQGIGARLVAEVSGRRLVREMYPANTYASQSPCEVYFGLNDSTQADRLTVRWPSGRYQELRGVPCDQHLVLNEADAMIAKTTSD